MLANRAVASRREFLGRVGQGMFVAGLGYATAFDLGLSTALAKEDGPSDISFGALEPLVVLMQETPADKLLPKLVNHIKTGTPLRNLVAAAGLANARAFGGEDYIGFHTLMALGPAYSMSQEMPSPRQALPVLKVLYRNTSRLQETGGRSDEALHHVEPADVSGDKPLDVQIREAVRARDTQRAEALLAAAAQQSPSEAYNDLLLMVDDATEVHRVVLAQRAWDLLDLVGQQHAHTMLRQSLRYCLKEEERTAKQFGEIRTLLPRLLDDHRLLSRSGRTRKVDDKWVDDMMRTLFTSTAPQAADAVAAALAEGIAPAAIGEAISLAANQLVLRDKGRQRADSPTKPLGSVHGDSIGVHACDSIHAWKNIARTSNQRHTISSLILAGYQVALDRTRRRNDFNSLEPWPLAADLEKVPAGDANRLLEELDSAIRNQDQGLACAVVQRYGEAGHSERPVFNRLLKYATKEDGALHAEKFYRTVSDEFATTRPAFRWRQLVALARVTASEANQPAPGYEEACGLLGVEV